MAARRIGVREVPPGDWPDRRRKSSERLKAVNLLMVNRLPDAALVEAVQAAIAAADAFTICHLGEQCVSERHEDAVHLVERVTGVNGLSEATRHLRRLLLVKA